MHELAFIIPCYNEAESVGKVVSEIKDLLPTSMIVICDNNSTDGTAIVAKEAGAEVIVERKKGKGNAVRRLLRDVEANIYIMVDGDHTYDLSRLPKALNLFKQGKYDLMTGDRKFDRNNSYFRKGHEVGNILFNSLFKFAFDVNTNDVFSGLRIFSRRLAKTLPITSTEFEIETELTIYTTRMRLPVSDFPTGVRSRVNSASKLSTFRDGLKILAFALRLLHREYPWNLYFPISFGSMAAALICFFVPYREFLTTGFVSKIPTLVTSTIFFMVSLLSFFAGIVLKEISNLKYESRYLAYLNHR